MSASPAECQGSMQDEVYVVGCSLRFFWTSTKAPLLSVPPTRICRIAYPTQFRMSSEPCSSQVLEDSVIKTRTYCVETGVSASLRETVPPCESFTAPDGKVFHSPCGPASKSSARFPTQYST